MFLPEEKYCVFSNISAILVVLVSLVDTTASVQPMATDMLQVISTATPQVISTATTAGLDSAALVVKIKLFFSFVEYYFFRFTFTDKSSIFCFRLVYYNV